MRAVAVTVALVLALPATAAARDFPRSFQWGVAEAGFQSEMGRGRSVDPGSDWWVWTHDRKNIEDGVVSGDEPEDGPGFFQRYTHDVDLAAERLHMKAFRLGIEWSRIFPRSTRGVHGLRQLDEVADHRALRRYRAILERIRARGMRPFVTLNHFTLPHWVHHPLAMRGAFAKLGAEDPPPKGLGRGWLDPGTAGQFTKYADYLSWKLGGLVDDWVTINEPVVLTANGYVNLPGVASGFPPGATNFPAAKVVLLHLMDANAHAYDAVKSHDAHARVGIVQNMIAWTPADPSSAADVRGTRHADYIFNRLFLDAAVKGIRDTNVDGTVSASERHPELAGRADFIGVNYYFRGRVSGLAGSISSSIPILDFLPSTQYRSPAAPGAPECPTTCSGDHGSEIYPRGFRQVLREAGGYGVPLIVTENGIGTSNDAQRRAYLGSHLRAMHAAMRTDGVDVRGYFEWSLTDNLEWNLGYGQHFGLYGFDPRTLERHERGSARLYARVARTGELP